MGNTTIIELNHDLSNEILDNKDEFLLQIADQLSHFAHNGKAILGGKIIAGFHRSGKIYEKWEKFKASLQEE